MYAGLPRTPPPRVRSASRSTTPDPPTSRGTEPGEVVGGTARRPGSLLTGMRGRTGRPSARRYSRGTAARSPPLRKRNMACSSRSQSSACPMVAACTRSFTVAIGRTNLASPKSATFGVPVRRQQDVGRLQVAVEDAAVVCVLNRTAELKRHFGRVPIALWPPGDLVGERSVADELEDRDRAPLPQRAAVEPDDVRVVETRGGGGFDAEPGHLLKGGAVSGSRIVFSATRPPLSRRTASHAPPHPTAAEAHERCQNRGWTGSHHAAEPLVKATPGNALRRGWELYHHRGGRAAPMKPLTVGRSRRRVGGCSSAAVLLLLETTRGLD